MKNVTIREVFDDKKLSKLQLKLISGEAGLDNIVKVGDLNRPGLTLSGFFDFFAYDRIQIFGLGESAYLSRMKRDDRGAIYGEFFSYKIPCCIYSHGTMPDEAFLKFSEKKGIPVYVSDFGTTRLITMLVHIFDEIFAEKVTLHGTFVDVSGIGVLLLGNSGVGKSETALELVERGHRLVADDMVTIIKNDTALLMGKGSEMLKHHMEIRGLGIVNIKEIFGIRSVRNKKRLDLVVKLEEWNSSVEYERLGLDDEYYEILGFQIPMVKIPVGPGRNIPVIIETAAFNQSLKKSGIHSARELDQKIKKWISKGDL